MTHTVRRDFTGKEFVAGITEEEARLIREGRYSEENYAGQDTFQLKPSCEVRAHPRRGTRGVRRFYRKPMEIYDRARQEYEDKVADARYTYRDNPEFDYMNRDPHVVAARERMEAAKRVGERRLARQESMSYAEERERRRKER